MARARFLWKSTCSTCRDARAFLRDEVGAELDERNYAREPFTLAELRQIFGDAEPREFINPKSAPFKALGLKDRTLSRERALALIVEQPNLLKRPLTIVGRGIIAGFDRARLRAALG